MIERNEVALLGVVLGTLGLAVGLTGGSAPLPTWVWVASSVAPVVLQYAGGALVDEAAGDRVRAAGSLFELAGAVAYGLLMAVVAGLVRAGDAPSWALLVAVLGVAPSAIVGRDALWRLRGRPAATLDLVGVGERWRAGRGVTPREVLRVVGLAPPLAVVAGLGFGAGALWRFVVEPGAPGALALPGVAVFFGSAAVLGAWQASERWRAVAGPGRVSGVWPLLAMALAGGGALVAAGLGTGFLPLHRVIFAGFGVGMLSLFGARAVLVALARHRAGDRFWVAQEGLVEESAAGILVFPWGRIAAFDLAEVRGRPAVRVWLVQAAGLPFCVLGRDGPEKRTWLARRIAALVVEREANGADLVLSRACLDCPPGEVYRALRRVARDPSSVVELPSVLDDPPEVDLAMLGLARRDLEVRA